ncbi:MAG: hypothetical protein R6V77_04795 [Candidatus Cloacimonadaceae bacterium]
MDWCSAVFASAFQQKIADDGDVKIEGQRLAAIGTMGLRQDDGLLLGKAVYEDIKKAAETGSQNDYEQ